MKVNISAPLSAGHGDEDTSLSIGEGMSIDDAIYHLVHSYPGGAVALAARMGMSANTLTHKANPNTTSHYVNPRELVALQLMTRNAAPLQAMARALGYVCTPNAVDAAGGDPVEGVMLLQLAEADFMRAVADALVTGKPVTRNQLRRAEDAAIGLQAAIGDMLACLRAQMLAAPEGGA